MTKKEYEIKLTTPDPVKQMEKFFKSTQIMLSMIGVAEIERQIHLIDYRFKNPNLNNHMKRVREGLEAVKNHFGNFVQLKDKEEFDYEFTIELHRLFSFFIGLSTGQLREYADGLEELLSNVKEEENEKA